VWIENGGVTDPATTDAVATNLPAISKPQGLSDGESEVEASDEALRSPLKVIPKVQLLDKVEHTLDKGVWEIMPAICHRWHIFIDVSTPVILG